MKTSTAIVDKAPYKGEALEVLEGRIQKGLSSYVEVGRDLKTIQENKLYKKRWTTFEDYCEERWGLARRSVYQIIDAAEVHENVYSNTQTPPSQTQALELSLSILTSRKKSRPRLTSRRRLSSN